MRRVAIAWVAVALLALLIPAASADARSVFFRAKPSGITCGALRIERSSATLRCDLPFVGRRAAFLHTKGKGEIKRVSSFLRPKKRGVLGRGSTQSYGPFVCVSLRAAVTCRTAGGHGFTVGRSFQLVF
jgi:hypothetical protein